MVYHEQLRYSCSFPHFCLAQKRLHQCSLFLVYRGIDLVGITWQCQIYDCTASFSAILGLLKLYFFRKHDYGHRNHIYGKSLPTGSDTVIMFFYLNNVDTFSVCIRPDAGFRRVPYSFVFKPLTLRRHFRSDVLA
jgi:hypothetical protein